MTERLLQFIWQFQYFSKKEMKSTKGEDIQILFPGQFNTNQGPDFNDAKIKIEGIVWAGNIELHLKTSDWEKHRHQKDRNYKNVILHVVWEDDGTKNNVPVVELKDRVSKILLQRYDDLMKSSAFIPCENSIRFIREITWKSWKERLLAERLLRKAETVEIFLRQNNYHWEETFWWLLARNFGMKVNADAFEAIARSIPLNILARHKNHVLQLEALLLGQAGLLEGNPRSYWDQEDYSKALQKEYHFQRVKYKLREVYTPFLFLRMRPGNFPTIRLAQLAMLVHVSAHLFSTLKEAGTVKEIKKLLAVTASEYWDHHYRFEEIAAFKKKQLGESMIDNIVINTISPVLFAYGNYHRDQIYKDKAVKWLEETAAESNSVTKGFQKLGMENNNAFDSQALIELKNEYCDKKRCLDCSVGNFLLKRI